MFLHLFQVLKKASLKMQLHIFVLDFYHNKNLKIIFHNLNYFILSKLILLYIILLSNNTY